MDMQTVLARLEEMGTEQTRKTYLRHGIGENTYGVLIANMKALAKEIKKDQDLAEQLWETGNFEARIMSTLIADPKKISRETLDAWVHGLDSHTVTDVLTSNLVCKTKFARELMEGWIVDHENEFVARTGWQMLALIAMGKEEVPDELFDPYLEMIETRIHGSLNRVKEAMNGALIAIGGRNDALEAKAMKIAAKIGQVDIDHGDTACKTPDATEYILKMKERKLAKMSKGKA